jgi:hypothetical protein
VPPLEGDVPVMDMAESTVRDTLVLVTAPAALVITTEYVAMSAAVTAPKFNVALVWPDKGDPFFCHR